MIMCKKKTYVLSLEYVITSLGVVSLLEIDF